MERKYLHLLRGFLFAFRHIAKEPAIPANRMTSLPMAMAAPDLTGVSLTGTVR